MSIVGEIAAIIAAIASCLTVWRLLSKDRPSVLVEQPDLVHIFNASDRPLQIDRCVSPGNQLYGISCEKYPEGYVFDEGATAFYPSFIVPPGETLMMKFSYEKGPGKGIVMGKIKGTTLYIYISHLARPKDWP